MALSEIIKMIEMEIANSDAEKLSVGKKLSDAIEKELPAIDDKSLDILTDEINCRKISMN